MARGKPWRALAAGCCIAAGLVLGVNELRDRRDGPVPATAAPGLGSGSRITYPADKLATVAIADGRTEKIRSVLNVTQPLRYGQSVWNDKDVPQGPVWIRVDLTHQLLSVFRAGHEIGTAVVLYGAADKDSPTGTFPVLQKAEDYQSHTYDAPMPFMLRLTADGVAIHGSVVRRGAATHGCIGVPVDFARKLFAQVRLGDPVMITRPL